MKAEEFLKKREQRIADRHVSCPICNRIIGGELEYKELEVHLQVYHDTRDLAKSLREYIQRLDTVEVAIEDHFAIKHDMDSEFYVIAHDELLIG